MTLTFGFHSEAGTLRRAHAAAQGFPAATDAEHALHPRPVRFDLRRGHLEPDVLGGTAAGDAEPVRDLVTVFAEVTGAIPTYSLRPGDTGGMTVTAKTAALLTLVAGALGIRKIRTLLTAAGAAVETLIIAATADGIIARPKIAAAGTAPLSVADGAAASPPPAHHGDSPDGLMALHAATFAPDTPWPLDVLRAKTEDMIGSLIVQELMNVLPPGPDCATLLTRVEVNPKDPAFDVVRGVDGKIEGVEAVIGKDRTVALLATALAADVLLLLTDVVTVFRDWGGAHQKAIARIAPDALEAKEIAPG